MEQINIPRRRVMDYVIDTTRLELWYVSPSNKRVLNWVTALTLCWWVGSFFFTQFVIKPKSINVGTLISVYISIIMMWVSVRFWWIWSCNPYDSLFWIQTKIRMSSMLLFLTLVSSMMTTLMIKTSDLGGSLFVDLAFTFPILITSLLLNLINIVRLLRLWYVYYKQICAIDRARQEEDTMINRVFRNREGYEEAKGEIEAAGIDTSELEEVQRMEMRNVRRMLSQFGSAALNNVNMLRMILNIDGDRDPEDTEENRVMLFSKITSLPYNIEKHGHAESCPICCGEFEEDKYIKVLPKCSHIFHEDCIEKWILKAKHRFICCPVCRVNIREEIANQEQTRLVADSLNEETTQEEDQKEDESEVDGSNNINLLNMTEIRDPESLA